MSEKLFRLVSDGVMQHYIPDEHATCDAANWRNLMETMRARRVTATELRNVAYGAVASQSAIIVIEHLEFLINQEARP